MEGVIYKLTDEEGSIYIGSHIKKNKYRLTDHKTPSNKCVSKNMKGTITIENIEEGTFDSVKDLRIREYEIMKMYPQSINYKRNVYISQSQHYQDNKQYFIDKAKEWEKSNPDKIKERNKRTQVNCECGGHYPSRNKKLHEKTKKHQNYINGI